MNNKKATEWTEQDWIEYVCRSGLTIVTLQLEASPRNIRIAIAEVRRSRGEDNHEEALEYFKAAVYMHRIYQKAVNILSA